MEDRSAYHAHQHSTLEPVPKVYPSKFAVVPSPEDTPKYPYEQPPLPPPGPTRSQRFTRWPFLILYALLVAIIAAVIGGFVGKTLETRKNSDTCTLNNSNDSNESTNPNNNNSTTPSSNSTTPTSCPSTNTTTSTTNTANPAIPFLSCPNFDIATSQSTYLKISYKSFCDVDWFQGPEPEKDIIGILAYTASDCIEACYSVNVFNGTSAPCVGGTFVPEWIDGHKAMKDNDAKPSNCFLKKKVVSVARRRMPGPVNVTQVVALCLEKECPPDP